MNEAGNTAGKWQDRGSGLLKQAIAIFSFFSSQRAGLGDPGLERLYEIQLGQLSTGGTSCSRSSCPDQYVARGPLKEMADMLFTMPGRPTKVSLTGASTGLRKGIARSDLR